MEGGSRWSLKDRMDHPFKKWPIHWEYLMLSLSRQGRWSDKLRNTPDSSLNEVPKVTWSWGKGRPESCSEHLLVVPATATATWRTLQNCMSSQDFILPIGKNMRTFFFLKMTFKSFLVHLQTTDWQSLCSGGRHTPRLQDVLSPVMVEKIRGGGCQLSKNNFKATFQKGET